MFGFLGEVTPQPQLVLNASFLAEARLLSRSEWYSRDKLDQLKFQRLGEICQYAYECCPYYTHLFDDCGFDPGRMTSPDDLRVLPLMEKADLQARLSDIVSTAVPIRRREYTTTGGSTGTPVGLYRERGVTYPRTYAYERRQYGWGGVGFIERRAYLRGRFFGEPAVRRFNNLYLSVVQLSPDTAESYVDALVSYSPTYIEAYPSAARFLADWILRQSSLPRFPRLKAVFVSSETLSDTDRTRIEQAFGSPVHNKYGNEEQATIIGQCEHGTMHEFEEYSFTEYLAVDPSQAPPGTAEIVSTTFVNNATPLIRYRTEDLAVLSSGSCVCGRALRSVQAVLGREQDYLLGALGERIGAASMSAGHDDSFNGIARLQYYQDEPGVAVMRVVPFEPLTDDHVREILGEVRRRSGGKIQFTVEVVQHLDTTARGKNRFIVRTCVDADGLSAVTR